MIEEAPKENTTLNHTTDMTVISPGALAGPNAEPTQRASIIVLAGWEIGREIELHGHGQTIGRSPLAHITVEAPSVSRQHARIERKCDENEEWYEVVDLNSSNGTFVNHARVESSRLQNGDKIMMGDVLFKFVLQDEAESNFHQVVHRLIHYDRLTGLLTLDAFRQRAEHELRRSGVNRVYTLAMTDLDGLKKVNDTHGHLAGRMIIREMGAMMRKVLRADDFAGLYGGDEGIVFYQGGVEEARPLAERLRESIEERVFEHHGATFQVSISQGLAEAPKHGRTWEKLVAAADRALYAAKAAGRNNVQVAE